MAVIAIFNQKGGVGKTTTALNLCAGLTQLHLRPLGIDLDPQGHLTLASGVEPTTAERSVYAFFDNGTALGDILQTLPSGLRFIPSTLDLAKIDALHGSDPQIATRLKLGIEREFARQKTPIIIDCCPMLSVLTLNALMACDRVLIPVSADFLSLQGVERLDRSLNVLEDKLHRRFERRVVITRFDARRRLSHDIYAQLKARFGSNVCATRITENVSLAESPMHAKDIYAFAPTSPGARDYRALTEELGRSGFFN